MLELPPSFLVGCDPELFVMDPDGRYVSAAGMIPGTKEEPHVVEGGAVQVDGMAAEFNTDPVNNFTDFWSNITKVMAQLQGFLPKGHTLSMVPAVTFDKEIFDAAPEDAKILGCTPDWNAWEMNVNPVPDTEKTPYLRTASGHLHFGWTENADVFDAEHMMHCFDFVKQLDWYLGAWSVGVDRDPTRRNLYGKSGACRVKPYGVEYRVLSNFWLQDEAMAKMVWVRSVAAIRDMSRRYLPNAKKQHNQLVRDMIDTSVYNKALASTYRNPIMGGLI